MSDRLAEQAEEWGLALLREAMSNDPREYGYGFRAGRAEMAEHFLNCALAIRSLSKQDKDENSG